MDLRERPEDPLLCEDKTGERDKIITCTILLREELYWLPKMTKEIVAFMETLKHVRNS